MEGRNALTSKMLIFVDENIPLADELFGSLGQLRLMNGRQIDEHCDGIEEADVLAIRSVTRITPALVDKARNLKVVGTATIGTDHIDTTYIEEANRTRERPISVISAPGSNAESVADYVWYALAHITRDDEEPLCNKSLGIIGYGNCGSRVARRAEGFGMRVLRHDPPLQERDGSFVSDPLEEVLQADFVSLHVPLTYEGESAYPTFHMIGRTQFQRMRPTAFLFNSSRGAVVNSADLIAALQGGTIKGAVLDVYEGEPTPAAELIALPLLATPHIAGYAEEGKRRGAIVIYEGICRALGVEPRPTGDLMRKDFRPPFGVEVGFDRSGPPDLCADRAVRALLEATHDIKATSDQLKATLSAPDRGALFDRLRKEYSRGARHELAAYRVKLSDSLGPTLTEKIERRLRGFGIQMGGDSPHFILR